MPGDQLGAAVVAADLNGDGFSDIVMAAPGSGTIYVVFGGSALAGTVDLSSRPGFVATVSVGAVGTLTLASGDFNGDGRFKDLAIGIPGWSAGTGAVFFVLGRPQASFPVSSSRRARKRPEYRKRFRRRYARWRSRGRDSSNDRFRWRRDYRSCGGRAGCGRPRERPARCRVCVRPLGRCAICDPAQSLRRRRHDLRSCVGAYLAAAISQGTIRRDLRPILFCWRPARARKATSISCTAAFEAGSRRSSTWPPVSIACCVPIPQALRSPPCWASK